MPSAAVVNKRAKQRRYSRNIIIGSEAFDLPPVGDPARPAGIPEQHTKRWTIYVRQPEGGPDMRTWLSKVTIKIHSDYKTPLRTIENPPYEVTETGWGGFMVDVLLFFVGASTEKPQYRQHYLQLEPYGDEAQKAKQIKEGLVRSEYLEVVEFNEPMVELDHALSDPTQFNYMRDIKQQAAQWGPHIVKGKKRALSPSEGSAQLPLRGSSGGTEESRFALDAEDAYIRLIGEKGAELDKMLAEELEKKAAGETRLQALRAELGHEAAAQATKEASGDRVRRR